jgi:hypothetical protein
LAKLNIPPPYKRGLAVLEPLDDGAFRAFKTGLVNSTSLAELKKAARASVSGEEAELLLESLLALQLVQITNEKNSNDFAAEVAADLERGKERIEFSDTQRRRFVERLSELFGIEAIAVQAKARDLQFEHAHVFVNGRVITDLRPVFGSGPQEAPSSMVLFHTLKVTYFDRQREGQATFYVALDEEDIGALKKILERAETKSKTLRSKLQGVGISCLAETPEG